MITLKLSTKCTYPCYNRMPHSWLVYKISNGNTTAKRGCPKCSKERVRLKRATGVSEFIERSNKIHSFKYNYDKVVYINQHTNVIINCPIHGDFTKCLKIICGEKDALNVLIHI